MSRFKDKKVLVTGDTRGIGRAIAAQLLREGACVHGTGTKPAEELTASAPEELTAVRWESADFADEDSTRRFLTRLKEESPFDGVVNNAGINLIKPVEEVTAEDYDFVQEVDLRAPYLIAREAAAGMMRAGKPGRIVNVASIWSVISKPQRTLYSTAKAGLLGLTRSLAAEAGERGILVNAVSPGFVLTDLTRRSLSPEQRESLSEQVPVGRMAEPGEIAKVVCFLLSKENSYLTGQNLVADGGFSIVSESNVP